MSDSQPASANRAVFLSYASQDAEAARRICDTLRASGVEVWFDADGGLEHGDEWDQKIRRQIRECVLFIAVISANTQARHEGYFRIEWELAAQRAMGIASGVPFILPVVIDDTKEPDALVPDRFRAVQWTKLRAGEIPPEVQQRFLKLWSHRTGVLKHDSEVARVSQPVSPASPAATNSGQETRATPEVGRRVPTAAWVVGLIALAAGGFVWWKSSTPAPTVAPNVGAGTHPLLSGKIPVLAPVVSDKSVAVLPFTNLSGDKEQEYFSDGLTEEVLGALRRERDLTVPGNTSCFSFKGKIVAAAEIARTLNVARLVEGSVQRVGSRVRIRVTLARPADNSSEELGTFTEELTDIFALQEKVARAVVAKLTRRTTTAPVAVLTKNPAAYDAFLRGRSMEARQLGGRSRRLAIPFYEEAVRLDPGFALGWAHLAHALAWVHWGSGEITGDEFERAQRALAEATRLHPDLAEVHLARAALLKSDGVNLREAARELALAERLKPNDPEIAFEQALVARFSGRLEEALAFCRRSIERDPQNPNVYNTRGLVLNFLGRYPEALAAFDQALALSYDTGPRANRAHAILRAEGDAAKALREYALIPEERLDLQWRVFLTEMQLAGGSQAAALAGIARIEQPATLSQWGFYVRPLLAARVKEMMGDAEGAHRDYTEALPMALAYRDRHPRSWRAYPAVAQAFAGLGRKEEALAAAREALKLVPPAENPYYAQLITLPVLVEMQARFGLADEALAIVREQIAAGWWRRHDLLLRPEFFFIRKDPRFRELAEQAPL